MAVSVGAVRGQVRTTGCCALIFREISKNDNIKEQARARTIIRGSWAKKDDTTSLKHAFRKMPAGILQAPRLCKGVLAGMRFGEVSAFKPGVLNPGNGRCTGH